MAIFYALFTDTDEHSLKQQCNTDRIMRKKLHRVKDCAVNTVAVFLLHAVFTVMCERGFKVSNRTIESI